MIDADWAGSCLSAVSITGITAPASPAIIIENTMDMVSTRGMPIEPDHRYTTSPVVIPTTRPLIMPARISLVATRSQLRARISRRASPRMVTARACDPVLPDCPATTGRKIARAVKRAIVSSNSPTTEAARKAVTRLICSHGSRLRMANVVFDRARSSRPAPTIAWIASLASCWAADTSAS